MSKSNEQYLGDAIKQLLNSTPKIQQKVNEIKLSEVWEKLMGKLIAKNTKSIVIKNKTLYLEIKLAALRNELFYAKEKIINSINAEFEEEIINEIVLK